MANFLFWPIFLLSLSSSSFSIEYEESLSEMLVECNAYQDKIFDENRTAHQCEKDNFIENLSYVVELMETRYSKKQFWCFVFLKDEYFKLKFKLWFSHKDYEVDAYGVKYKRPENDKWESRIKFPTTVFVVAAKKGFELPQIFGMELNGVDKCPLCGMRLEKLKIMEKTKLEGRIAEGEETDSVVWPWHSTIYQKKKESLSYICGGTLIQSQAVVTTANCLMENNQKIKELDLQVAFGENFLLSEGSQRSEVFRSIIHEDFNSVSFEDNIGLLMLQTKIKFSSTILPICLPQFGTVLEGVGTAIGFGKSKDGIMTLQEVNVTITDKDVCFASDNDFYEKYLNVNNFCGGTKEKGGYVCGGDAGGGLYVKKGNSWMLKGITSIVRTNPASKNPTCDGFALFLDASRYGDWIEEAINSL